MGRAMPDKHLLLARRQLSTDRPGHTQTKNINKTPHTNRTTKQTKHTQQTYTLFFSYVFVFIKQMWSDCVFCTAGVCTRAPHKAAKHIVNCRCICVCI